MLGIFGRNSKIFILSVLILALFSTYNITYSQENINEILTNEKPSKFDNWSIGIIGGLN